MSSDTTLQHKAISIKGKQYVLVSDRILAFNEMFPQGSITTTILTPHESKRVVIQAVVRPDAKTLDRAFIAHSQAVWGAGMVNTEAALENAETSAVGRALGMMGIGVIDSVASADEMAKAGAGRSGQKYSAPASPSSDRPPMPTTTKRCEVHDVEMEWKWSTKKHMWFATHTLPDSTYCYGRGVDRSKVYNSPPHTMRKEPTQEQGMSDEELEAIDRAIMGSR